MSWTMTPMVCDLAVTKARAKRFGSKARRSAAESTRWRVSSLTGWLDPDMTREAVATDTPASWATCRKEFVFPPSMAGSDAPLDDTEWERNGEGPTLVNVCHG
jgi:hypothetical protein